MALLLIRLYTKMLRTEKDHTSNQNTLAWKVNTDLECSLLLDVG